MSLRLWNEGTLQNSGLEFGSASSYNPTYYNNFMIHTTSQPQMGQWHGFKTTPINHGTYTSPSASNWRFGNEPNFGWNGVHPANRDYGAYTVASPLTSDWSGSTGSQQGWEHGIQSEVMNPFNNASTSAPNYYFSMEPQLNGYSFQPAWSIEPIGVVNFPHAFPSASSNYTFSFNHENTAEEGGASLTSSTRQTGTNQKHSRITEDRQWQCIWPLARGGCGEIFSRPQDLKRHQKRLDHAGPDVSCELFECPCGEKRVFRKDAAVRHTRNMYARYKKPIPDWLAKRTRGSPARRRRNGGIV